MNLLDVVNDYYANPKIKEMPDFRSGDTLAVHAKIREGDKVRIQVFEGVCIGIRIRGHMSGSFRVRKISSGVGVERIFPFHSPNIEKVVVLRRGKSRRSKLYYLRHRSGKGARIAVDYERKS